MLLLFVYLFFSVFLIFGGKGEREETYTHDLVILSLGPG
jgi:hypothetical protein